MLVRDKCCSEGRMHRREIITSPLKLGQLERSVELDDQTDNVSTRTKHAQLEASDLLRRRFGYIEDIPR